MKLPSEKDFAAHVQAAFSTPSGEVVWEWFRTACFMKPSPSPEPCPNGEAALSRVGLMNLFRRLEFYRTTTLNQEQSK